MKFNIFFTIHAPGTGKTISNIPNKANPVEAESMSEVLKLLKLPDGFGVIVTAIRVEKIDDDPNQGVEGLHPKIRS